MQFEINAKKRDLQGSSASRRLRRAGRVPGIVYGAAGKPQSIDMDHNEIYQALRKEAFHSSIVTVNVEGDKQMALLRDVQVHAYKLQVLHVDFQRVDATHQIHQKVPLHFINADINPGVKLQGGMVSHVMTEVDVKCLPADLPEFIEVDLKDLATGHSLHVSQLALPKGVEVAHHGEGDPVVATVIVKGGKAEEEAPAAEAPAEKK
ncbi:50S ribosomal protein L25/general stress protein Ctc [Denitratisoma sp. DHT3]|uniref:50S ribosomal protein L25/general stress protein Ctc n=1 Tax=Denitratisoma sp. DHT3 TaxID=1981880 RepID=UPI0011985CD8|nr:50S ribosomal protein L25/general stress protein Ctc [Denitratisoma sp. DHT3]QDX82021.1 50S ribosomal protein L25/general stress protein Ctc [Denitratisoma sp. DHT3]